MLLHELLTKTKLKKIMKMSISIYKFFTAFALLFLFSITACDKSIADREQLEAFLPASLDQQAGNWKTVVLANANEISIPEPAAIQSNEYRNELAQLKTTVSKLTNEQKEVVKYWSGGVMLRWNQIMRELVAKYNLPPVHDSDGTYPFPDPNNPLAYPLFPFANPPYAARAYAYIAVAQYDALVAAWNYKFKFNRPAPSKTDNTIQSLVPIGDLPSYPSEDAVIAAASLETMKLLFPGEVNFLTQKAEECKNYALWSGKNVLSDIIAGEALGKAVAAKAVARARNDGAGAAGNPAMWKALEQAAIEKGETPWISLETPHRPPMLPGFGKVKPWMFTTEQMISFRPAPPPSTKSEQMKKEIEEVKWYAKNMTRERLRIVHFWADGVGTHSPPGHWNAIAADLVIKAKMSEVRAARIFALTNMSLMDAAIACWDVKNFYFNPRPSQLDPSIKTGTGVPNFPAYTSGHSTFSSTAATVLSYLFPNESQKLQNMALEASISRLYGGIHYRSDCKMGVAHGKVIGQYTINWAKQAGE